jgi:hypothetical protein
MLLHDHLNDLICVVGMALEEAAEVEASRESLRIGEFLKVMLEQGRLTPFEREIIEQEEEEAFREAGYLDQDNRPTTVRHAEEFGPIQRHANHRMRKKFSELHPEMIDELTQFIELRKHHPLPPLPPELSRPGAAHKGYLALLSFIEEKRKNGEISHREAHDIYEPSCEVMADAGVNHITVHEMTNPAVLAQAATLMKRKLLELHPEMSDAVRNLGPARSK